MFSSRSIALLCIQPENYWDIERRTVVLYYLMPNIQITVAKDQVTLFKIYPDKECIGGSITRVGNYLSSELQVSMDAGTRVMIDGANVYHQDARDGNNEALTLDAINEIVNSTLEQKDYYVGEMVQKSAASRALEHIIFGPNEPVLHHFHASYRGALDLPPLEQL